MGKDTEARIILTAEDNVSSAVKKVMEALGETGLGQAVTAASTAFSAMTTAVEIARGAVHAIEAQFATAIHAASEMETTNRKLALSLLTTGDYTKESFDSIMDWSDGVEAATGMGNEMALELVILGKNMGLTAQQAKDAAQAAVDMGAALGMDANTAMRQLTMTMSGMTGRLGRMIPELEGLTQAQLKNGAAIDLIKGKYAGLAAETANTFEGAQKKLAAQISNVYEAFGRMIVQNPVIIDAMTKTAKIIGDIAKKVDELSTFVLNNIDTVKDYAIAFGIAVLAVTAYIAVINGAAIAQTALTAATIVYNTVSALTPWGLVIAAVAALTAGIGYLITHWQQVSAVIQEYVGAALQKVISVIEFVIQGHLALVSIFSKDLAAAISSTLAKWKESAKAMEQHGIAAGIAAEEARKNGQAHKDASDVAGAALKGLEKQAEAAAQAALKVRTDYAKAVGEAHDVFAKLKDLTPTIQLAQFKQDAENWKTTLKELQQKAGAMKLQIEAKIKRSPEDEAALKGVEEQIKNAEIGLKAVKIKIAKETRDAAIKEVEIGIQQEHDMVISARQEIHAKRIQAEDALRGQLIAMHASRLIEERGLDDAEARAGVDMKTAANLKANEMELSAFKAHLDAQMALAVDMEQQKQTQIAEVKASAASGLGGAGEAGLTEDSAVAKEMERQQKLLQLRDQELIDEDTFNRAMTQSRINETTARNQMEAALLQERIQLLGLGEGGMEARLAVQQDEYGRSLEALQLKYDNELMTDQEFMLAKQEAEAANSEQMAQIKEEFISAEISRNERLGNDWEASLAKIRLEQQKHGALMGTIRGIYQSQEMQATQQMFGNLASLRNSGNKAAFETGKRAAAAQTLINTFQSATAAFAALAPIPIVGPALGTAAAAAAVIAGYSNVRNILAQQFSPAGQADEGIDSIPASMSGKSFIVSGGERILQPEANKDMTAAAERINSGASGGGHTINLYNYGEVPDKQISKMKGMIIEVLRSESERGTPIIHEKGIVRG